MNVEDSDIPLLLMALHNAAKPVGLGSIPAREEDLTLAEAEEIVARVNDAALAPLGCAMFRVGSTYAFNYVYGRKLLLTIEKGQVTTFGAYDHENGEPGHGEAAVRALFAEHGRPIA